MKNRISKRTFLPYKIFHITPFEENLITGIRCLTSVEIMCVVSGTGVVEVSGEKLSYCAGDVFVFSPGEYHGVKDFSQNTDMLCFTFEPYYIWFSQSGFGSTGLLDSFLNRSSSYKNKLSKKAAEYVFPIICSCEDEIINLDVEYESAIKVKLADILIYILRNCGYAKNQKPSSGRSYNMESLKKSMEYIDDNLHQELDLESLSKAANMSRSYFCTIFKRYNGLKPWDYITIKRIDKAMGMLSVSSEKKVNIAFDCGFNNTANFYRAFKKITGKTPGDYEFMK